MCSAGEAPGVVRREDRPGESRDDDAAGDGAGDDGDDRLRPAPRSVRPLACDAAAEVFARLRCARAALVGAFGTGDALALPPGSLDGVDVSNLKQWPGFVSLGARGRDGSTLLAWSNTSSARRLGARGAGRASRVEEIAALVLAPAAPKRRTGFACLPEHRLLIRHGGRAPKLQCEKSCRLGLTSSPDDVCSVSDLPGAFDCGEFASSR